MQGLTPTFWIHCWCFLITATVYASRAPRDMMRSPHRRRFASRPGCSPCHSAPLRSTSCMSALRSGTCLGAMGHRRGSSGGRLWGLCVCKHSLCFELPPKLQTSTQSAYVQTHKWCYITMAMAPSNGTTSIHSSKVGRHPPPTIAHYDGTTSTAPCNGTLVPHPMRKSGSSPSPPIGSKKPHSYSYLGEKTFKTCMLEELFFFEIHVPKQLQSFDTRMLYSTDTSRSLCQISFLPRR